MAKVPIAEDFFILFIMFMGSISFAAMFGIFLLLLSIKTPAWTFLKASMKHRPLVLTFRRDAMAEFVTTDEYSPGLVSTKYGGFLIDEDSPYSEKKSKVTLLLANAEHGVTKSVDWLQLKAAMKYTGFDSIEHAYAAEAAYHKCIECGYTGIMHVYEDDDGERYFACPNKVKEEEHERGIAVTREAESVQEPEPRETEPPAPPGSQDPIVPRDTEV